MKNLEGLIDSAFYTADAMSRDLETLLNAERTYRGVSMTGASWDDIADAKKVLALARMDADASIAAYRVARKAIREAKQQAEMDASPSDAMNAKVTKY
jgi:hypothetical protein